MQPQLKQGLKMRVHTPTCRSVDLSMFGGKTRVVLGRPQNKSSMYETKNQNNKLKFRIVVVSSMSMAQGGFFKFNWSFNLWHSSFWNYITKDWCYKSVRFIVWIGKCWTKWTETVFFWKVFLNSSPWRNPVSLSIHISGLLTENLCGMTGYECFHASTLAFKLVHKLLFFEESE